MHHPPPSPPVRYIEAIDASADRAPDDARWQIVAHDPVRGAHVVEGSFRTLSDARTALTARARRC